MHTRLMTSVVFSSLIGLAGVVIGGGIASATAWWQASIARKDRLTELDVQLRHERFLRDETIRRTAMLELSYAFRRFSGACVEAYRKHDHNKTLSDQSEAPGIIELVKLGQLAIETLDKNVALVSDPAQADLEYGRDAWDNVLNGISPYPPQNASLSEKICCEFGKDLEILEIILDEAVFSLDGQLAAMRIDRVVQPRQLN